MVTGVINQPPVRQPSGATTDQPWQPLADDGYGNPFFYHAFQDDFDFALGATGLYTVTPGASVVHTAGDGGLALFTTGAVAGNQAEIQLPAASVTVTASKKLFYLARLQLADATNSVLIAGLINTTTTPFAAIADGIWFSKANLSTQLNINTAVGSSVVTTAIPGALLANNTNIDIGFYVNRQGDVLVFFGAQLVGFIPNSGSGTLTPPQAGPNFRLTAPALTTANLNLTMAISNGTAAAAKTLTADFHMFHKER